MSELIDPKTLDYPSNEDEWATFMRLRLARGSNKLTPLDVKRIEEARQKRARRAARRTP